MIPKKELLNVPVTCLPLDEQIMLMLRWAKMRTSKVVCLANVHMLMEAYWHPAFKTILHKADLVTPDGKPLVLMLRRLGIHHQNQVSGMDVFLNLCNLSESTGVGIYFLGSTNEILAKIKHKLNCEYPILKIAGMKAIPHLSIEEIYANRDTELIEDINKSRAGIVFVCLGCPKQEIWMSQYQGLINGVMIGVGAVFSMYVGINPRAPQWIQQANLEWLYRLLQEPRRLWRRYGSTIPPFLYLAIKQLLTPYQEKLNLEHQNSADGHLMLNIDELDTSPKKIGDILVRQGLITRDILDTVIKEQEQACELKIGEILIKKNFISLPQLKYYLRNQNIKLGEILLEQKLIKNSKLKQILVLQKTKKPSKKLGKILQELNILSDKQIEMAILEQYWRRKGLWLNQQTPGESSDSQKIYVQL
jgi:N-acetylglucosaminyldiphosphoundecaprenol N-acetyl-beta-D-mannosaminyltransferase